MQAKHKVGDFEGFFEGAKIFLGPKHGKKQNQIFLIYCI
jgi:hypothetical protein